MISTKLPLRDVSLVPSEWIFEYYLNLNEKLMGQDVKILSPFNSKDSVPSMSIYLNSNGKYKFNDFSTGRKGDGINLVMHLQNIESPGLAISKILEDYHNYNETSTYQERDVKIRDRYKVVSYHKRPWNSLDAKYWLNYNISSKKLEEYNVIPLSGYSMSRDEDGIIKTLTFESGWLYGYFRSDGTLYKIYQPNNPERKFIKVSNYIQGTDQLKYKSRYLVIQKSLKDIMCLSSMNFNIEIVAPDSENSMIRSNLIDSYKLKYDSICVMMDNDDPGIAAMAKYTKEFGIPSLLYQKEKDITDSVKKHGFEVIRKDLFPLLKKVLNEKK